MFSWLSILWNNKFVRSALAGAAALGILIGSVLWVRKDAADDREKEVRNEVETEALKKRVEIESEQNKQSQDAAAIRQEAEAPAELPSWMTRASKPENGA
jgi:hydroxylamine reductase (hybrid-cluster protein)